MKLKKVQIKNFQSIRDSNEFDIDQVTCLVGKNEAGKTALLKALHRLNPIADDSTQFDPTDDYPRSLLSEYEDEVNSGRRPHNMVVCAVFELEPEDTSKIQASFGQECLQDGRLKLTLSRDYGNQLHSELDGIDERAAIEHLITADHLSNRLQEALTGSVSASEVLKRIDDQSDLGDGSQEWLETLNGINSTDLQTYVYSNYVQERIPTFLYFDEYYQLTGQENIDALRTRISNGDLRNSDYPLIGLIELAGLSLDQLASPGRTESLIARIEAAQSTLTSKVLKYWSQNRHLRMMFDVRQGQPQDPVEMQNGMNVWGRVQDTRHMMTTGLGTRSRGFVWFFSFLAWYSHQCKQEGADSLILLLDEPGLSLHARAQGDLLRYFEEELAPSHQLIYTTHSPFMVDAAHFNRVRIVQDLSVEADSEHLPESHEGTKVLTDVLAASADSLFPLQGALGYEIHQTLFIGPNCLIVEGVSELMYLQAISALLERHDSDDMVPLREDWVITPVGGITKVPTFIALIGAQKDLNLVTLVDFEHKYEQSIEDLYKRKLIARKNVLTFADFVGRSEADIEDMFDDEFYLELFNLEFGTDIAIDQLPPGTRITKRIEDLLDRKAPTNPKTGSFNHYRPARYFGEHLGTLVVPQSALERFSQAFKRLNELL